MKTTKRMLSLVLALVMVCSLCVPTMAATKDTVKQYNGYLAIGDSMTLGYCASGNDKDNNESSFSKGFISGCYVDQLSKAVGCTKLGNDLWCCAYPALTTAGVLGLLGENNGEWDADFSLDTTPDNPSRYDYALQYYADAEKSYGYTGSKDGKFGSLVDITAEADLITIALGMSDVIYRNIVTTLGNVLKGGDVDLTKIPLLPLEMAKSYAEWVVGFPRLLQYIQKVNPDATVVLVGVPNLIFNCRLTDDTLLPLGDLLSKYTSLINQHLRLWAALYHMSYADASNVETGCTQYDWPLYDAILKEYDKLSHPTPEGYTQITREILSVLPVAEGKDADPVYSNTDIVVDLGRLTSVSSVRVNGRAVSAGTGTGCYEMNGSTLIVHYGLPTAVNLTVYSDSYVSKGSVTEFKKEPNAAGTAMTIYQLAYHLGEGYDAYRMYTTNDVDTVRNKLTPAGMVNTAAKLVNTIKGLLGGKTTL